MPAVIGSISHGTLRTQDLLRAFTDELTYQGESEEDGTIQEAMHYAWLLETFNDTKLPSEMTDAAQDTIQALFDMLEELAPPYCYFGANDGDGSDFGFWPSWDSIEELPKIDNKTPEANAESIRQSGEDYVYVNDHGNVTIYSGDGKIIWDCV